VRSFESAIFHSFQVYTTQIIGVILPLISNYHLEKEFLMTVEQVARDVVMHMNDVEKLKAMSTADAMASGGVLPQPIPMM
jgi:hypothetical protein